MENKLLKELYDHFYTRPELDEQENEVEECHRALIRGFGKTGAQAGTADHRCTGLHQRTDLPRQLYRWL